MERLWQKIKAILKIVIGATILYFMSIIIAVPAMLFSGAGAMSIVIGGLMMVAAIAVGAYLGGLLAKKNIIEIGDAKSIAIWSASIFFATNMMLSAAGSILMLVTAGESIGLITQAMNIIIQSFVIYYFSFLAMRQDLSKK